jgi:molecular chaperone HscB
VIDFSRNHFELFGLPERFGCDGERLDRAYRALQSEVHPDRFAAADEAPRRVALQSSARVNEAYRALKEPVDRAQYLLSLRGFDVLIDTDSALPLEFLERQLERREAVADAQAGRDAAALERLHAEVATDRAAIERELAALLDGQGAWEAARARVRELKFLGKLAADIDNILAELES